MRRQCGYLHTQCQHTASRGAGILSRVSGLHLGLPIVVCILLASCSKTPQDFHVIWAQAEPLPSTLRAPSGFEVTPAQACAIVREQPWVLSLKHPWHVYADSHHYYIHDGFWGESARSAYEQGVRVDGRSGQIVAR